MSEIHLKIDNQPISAPEGTTILIAAAKAGIKIPFLCWVPGTDTKSNCGLCVVEAEGCDRLIPACATPISENMEILTNTEDILDMRRNVIEAMFGDDVHDCEICHRNGNCSLQVFLKRYQLNKPTAEDVCNALGL